VACAAGCIIPLPWRGADCAGCERTCAPALRPLDIIGAALRPLDIIAGAELRPEDVARLAPPAIELPPPAGRDEPDECVALLIMRDIPLEAPPPPPCGPPPGRPSSVARVVPTTASRTLAKTTRATRRPAGTEIDAIFDMALLT